MIDKKQDIELSKLTDQYLSILDKATKAGFNVKVTIEVLHHTCLYLAMKRLEYDITIREYIKFLHERESYERRIYRCISLLIRHDIIKSVFHS